MESFKDFLKRLAHLGAPFHVEQGTHSRRRNPFAHLGAVFRVKQGGHSGERSEKDDIKEDVNEKVPTRGGLIIRLHTNMHGSLEGHKPLHDELTKAYSRVHLTPEYNDHVRDGYTADSSDLNKHLFERFHAGHLEPSVHDFKTQTAGIDKVIASRPLEKPVSVVSGLRRDVGMLAKQHQEKFGLHHPILFHPSYMSTSLSFQTAVNFAKNINEGETEDQEHHFLHIHLQPGQHAVYVGDRSKNPGEHELLLPRRSMFKLHATPDSHRWASKFGGSGTFHVWHASVINPDGKVSEKP